MDALLRALLRASLVAAGWIDAEGRPLDVSCVRDRISPHLSQRWLNESLAVLSQAPCEVCDLHELWARWNTDKPRWIQTGDHEASILLVETCLRALPEVLCGRALPTEVMFPGSSTDLVGAIYRDNPLFDGVNDQLADALATLIQERRRVQPAGDLRILEVGAGTGATTAAVLARLETAGHLPGEYCFTDVSRLFLTDAEQRFAGHSRILRTRLFNIEAPAAEQDVSLDAYDFIIAANVVHATANIRKSLRNIKALLRHNGVLLLHELSAKTLFNHLTFGLLEGWWRYEDDGLRIPGTPLLAADAWLKALRSEGFREILRLPATHPDSGHEILVAESDGWVRIAADAKPSLAVTEAATPKPQRATEVLAGSDPAADLVRQFLADTLRIPRRDLRDHASFFEYGVDSLIAGRLINRINRSLGLTLRTNALFEHGSIAKLTRHIADARELQGQATKIARE